MKTHKYQVTYTVPATKMVDNGDGTCSTVPTTKTMTQKYMKKVDAYADIRRLLGDGSGDFIKAEIAVIGESCKEWYDTTNFADARITR